MPLVVVSPALVDRPSRNLISSANSAEKIPKSPEQISPRLRIIARGTSMFVQSWRISIVAAVLMTICGLPLAAGERNIKIRWGSGWSNREYELRGDVLPTDDDRSIRSISPGGFVRVEDGSWFEGTRSYEIRADGSGQLTRTYRVAGTKRDLDPQAAAWAESAIQDLLREAGVAIPERVERLLTQGGPQAVLTFVSRLRSDGSKTAHLRELVRAGKLNSLELRDTLRTARRIGSDGDRTRLFIDLRPTYSTPDLEPYWFTAVAAIGSDGDKRRALEHAIENGCQAPCLDLAARTAERIGSDGDKSAVLGDIAERYTPAIRRSFFRAARTIGSDGDRRQVLSKAMRSPSRDRSSTLDLLQATSGIGSDGDKSAVLSELPASDLNDAIVQRAFLRVAATVGSDGDRSHLLKSVLQHKPGPASRAAIAEAARQIGSDGDKTAVLNDLAEGGLDDPALRKAFFESATTVGNENERLHLYKRALPDSTRDPEIVALVLKGARTIGSDSDRQQLLEALLHPPFTGAELWASYFDVLNTIGSDSDRARLLKEVLKQPAVTKEVVVAAIQSASRLGSDNDKASTLLAVAATPHASDTEVRSQIRRVMESMSSDGDYRRVSRALDAKPER